MQILYEDNHLLIVVKPANMPVQQDQSGDLDLLTELKNYLKEKYQKPGNVYLGLVHRLDRPVAGVMVFAKTSKAASRLANSMQKNQFKKVYYAVVCGQAKPQAHLEDYLSKNSTTNTVHICDAQHGKKAVLDYRLLQTINHLSLVEVTLQTGRSHQIRVQMSNANLPLWGDQRYNKDAKVGQQIALFAKALSFPHPVTKNMMSFEANPKGKPFSDFDL